MTQVFDVAVIGGGAAGLMAGIAAARGGARAVVLERNPSPGRKLLLTGGGRCNVTHEGSADELIQGIPGNGRFLYPAFNAFSAADLRDLLASRGVDTVVEAGGRVFPRSDRAQDVLNALTALLAELGVKLVTSAHVDGFEATGDCFAIATTTIATATTTTMTSLAADGSHSTVEDVQARRVIVATGGLSYPATGSTGDGFAWAERLGHGVIAPRPALVGLLTAEPWSRAIPGVTLRNVRVSLKGVSEKRGSGPRAAGETGDLLFTHFGVSGPPILNLSRWAARAADKITVTIATDPAASLADWVERIEAEVAAHPKRSLANLAALWWPKALAEAALGDEAGAETGRLPPEERVAVARRLHGLELTATGTRPVNEAIVTQGGVDTKEVNPRTLESKLVPGLYFAGEILDIDGVTGGYNLQAAFSTGHLAGLSAATD